MTIDEAIADNLRIAEGQDKCAEISASEHAKERIKVCAADHRQLAEWLTELKEAKRLLKAAVDDFTAIAEVRASASPILCPKYYGTYMKAIDIRTRKWRYTDEALKLIVEEEGD